MGGRETTRNKGQFIYELKTLKRKTGAASWCLESIIEPFDNFERSIKKSWIVIKTNRLQIHNTQVKLLNMHIAGKLRLLLAVADMHTKRKKLRLIWISSS